MDHSSPPHSRVTLRADWKGFLGAQKLQGNQGRAQLAHHSVVGGLSPRWLPRRSRFMQLSLALQLQLKQRLHGESLLGQASPQWGRGAGCRGHWDCSHCLLLL